MNIYFIAIIAILLFEYTLSFIVRTLNLRALDSKLPDEFKDTYGVDVDTGTYVNTLYENILGREADQEGYEYWVEQLNSGQENRGELLLGFAESIENQALFSEVTGLF